MLGQSFQSLSSDSGAFSGGNKTAASCSRVPNEFVFSELQVSEGNKEQFFGAQFLINSGCSTRKI